MLKLLGLVLILLCLSLTAFGQGGTGSINGRVTDPAGAAVVGAKVTVTNISTNATKEITSNNEGLYQVLLLPPGDYKILVEAQGFKKLERPGVQVQVADKLGIDLKLEVGAVGETTTVTAEIPLLRTEDAQTGEVVTYQNVQNLPQVRFGAARDPLQFLIIAGNVQGDGSRAEGGSDTRINGGRAQGVEYYIDGISATTGVGRNISQAMAPNMDSVAEFKVITNGISAEYGRLSGGAVELVTKSGTNAIHGQVFNYLQNPVLNANTWFNNRTNGAKQEYRQNNFGVALGGPVVLPRFGEGGPALWKGTNRTFWFFNYDGLRNSEAGNSVLLSVPTAEERQGIFTNTRFNGVAADLFRMDSPVIPDPTSGSSEIVRTQQWVTGADDPRPACRNQQGRCLPLNQISRTSSAILNLLPLPNRAPENNSSFQNNFVGTRGNVRSADQWAVRLDHRFSDSKSIYGRFSRLNSNNERTPVSGYVFSRAQKQEVKEAFGITMGYNWQISPTLIFDAKIGGSHNPFNNGGFLAPGFSSAGIPFDAVTRSYLGTNEFPGISVVGLGTVSDTWGENQSRNRNLSTYNANASMIKIMGKHTAKFGYEHRRYYDSFGRSSSSDFYFISSSVNRVVGDRSWQNYDQANGIATFLYGYNHYALAAAPVDRTTNTNYHGAYIQDDWRMTQKLTIGLGVRWDGETPTTERYNKLYFWDNNAPSQWTVKPGYDLKGEMRRSGFTEAQIARVRVPSYLTGSGLPTGAIRKAGTPEFPGRAGQSFYPWQFAPRLSMAYAVNEKTVIRASFAKMYISTTGDENGPTTASGGIALGDQAFNGWHHTPDGFRTILSNWDNPYVRTGSITKRADTNQLANFQASFGEPAAAFDRNIRMPHEWTWSLGLQRQVGSKLALEATYSANLGRRLLGQDVISRFPRDLLAETNRDLYFPDTTGSARRVPTPFVQPIQQFGEGTIDVGWLQYDRPPFGPVYVNGAGVGSSDYHSVNFRANYRFFKESNVLMNYTIGQSKDNVGGSFGQFGKTRQTFDSVDAIYGLSPVDERHRLTVVYNVEMPFGKGRSFLGSPSGAGGKVLDYIVGGWSVSGITSYRSGRPITFPGVQDLNSLRIVNTFFNTVTPDDQNLVPSGFGDPRSVLDPTGALGAQGARALDFSKFRVNVVRNAGGQITGYSPITGFFPGNLFPVFGGLRNPGYFSNDVSLGKRFALNGDGLRYFQLRFEGSNIFNHTGLGGYQTNLRNDTQFGRIVDTIHVPRRIQVSGRIVF